MWAQIINILLGLWLMAAPEFLGHEAIAADNGHIAGPLLATFSLIACWEATRGVRKWNLPIALWLLAAPWALGYESTAATISDMATGILVFLLSLVRGRIVERFGGGWKALFTKEPEHMREARK